MWAKNHDFESMKEKAIGKTSEHKNVYMNMKLTNFKDSFRIDWHTINNVCMCVLSELTDWV